MTSTPLSREEVLSSMPEGMFHRLYEAIKTGEPFDESWEAYDDAISNIWLVVQDYLKDLLEKRGIE